MKNCIKSFLLFVVFLGTTNLVSAQFVTPEEAISILTTEVTALENQIQQMNSGSPTYSYVFAKKSVLEGTKKSLIGGKSVAESITQGFTQTDYLPTHVFSSKQTGAQAVASLSTANDNPTFREEIEELLAE